MLCCRVRAGKAQSCQKLAVTLTVLALSLGMTGIVGAANNTAGSGSGVAVGTGSSASDATSTAIGQGATVNVLGGVAIGSSSVANVTFGKIGYAPIYMTLSDEEKLSPVWRAGLAAVSVGVQDGTGVATVTRQIVGVAAGTEDTDAANVAQLKILNTKIDQYRTKYISIKTDDTVNIDNNQAFGDDSMAIGPSAKATYDRALAIGKSTIAYTDDGVALGSYSQSNVSAGMRGYIPTSVTLTEEEQTTPTWKSTLGAVSIGVPGTAADGAVTTATQTRQIVGVAAGTQDTDAVNVAQLKALGSTVDSNKISFVSVKQKSSGENDNENNDGATGDDATAIGVFASATGANSTALGVKSQATASNAIALGDFAAAKGIGSVAAGDYAAAESHGAIAVGSEAKATGMQSIALGDEAKGTGYQATVVGGEATASGLNALAVGFGSNVKGQFGSAFGGAAAADGDFATAAGYGANASANSATALGENTTANIAGGVALGSYSKTNVNSGVLGYDPSDKITTQEILLGDNKDTYDNLQTEITTARSNVSSLAQQILDLQTEYDTADETRRAEIVNEIKSLNTQFVTARADLQDKVSAANKLVSTWQATGAAVSVGDSETGLTRQITNVAAGSEDTDAVNVAQLKQLNNKVDEGWNLAVGRGSASTSDYDSTVEGDSAQIEPGGTVTLQAGRGIKLKQDGPAVEIGLKYLDVEPKGDTYNDAAASGEGALAIGQNSVASGQQGTAVGFAAQATGKSSFAGGTEAQAGDNSVAIGTNAIANGQESIAIGRGTGNATDGFKKVDSTFSIAIGSRAYVGENSMSSVAIGGSSQVTNSGGGAALGAKAKVTDSINGTAIGTSATVSGSKSGTAIGNGAKVLANVEAAVALGSQSVADRANGTAGYDVTGTDHSNDAAGTWKSGLGAISVGKTGNTRQITNVAAGSEDTDAVNVAQLKAAGTAGLNFKGDGDTAVHRDLGETLNVVGGNTDADSLTDNNIGVVADATTGTLNVKLAKNLTLNDGSITFAPTGAKDADGNTLVQGQDGKWYSDLTDAIYDATNNVYTKADGTTVSAVENPVVSEVKLSNTGLDNGGNKITNVAAGTEDTDIVNVKQLKGSTIKSSDVTYADNGSGTITLTMQDGSKVTIDSLKDTYVKEGKLENNKLTFTRNDNTSFEVGDIASKREMDKAVEAANLKFTGDDTADAATLTKKNGETLNILGGASEFTTANNIGVVKDGEALKVKLAKSISMGDGSVTFANAKDASGNTLVQGQDGKWYSDLTDATYDATNNVYTKADGTPVSAVENPTVSEVKLSNTGLDNGGNKITNVAAGTEDTDIVNVKQLKGSTIESSAVTYADNGSGTITLTMQDGSKVTIDSLKDIYVKEGKLENNKLTFTRNDNTSFEVGDIASKSEMDTAVKDVNLKFTGDDTADAATLTKKNGETLNILGGASEFTTANNIGVVKDGEALKVKLAKSISMGDGSVTFTNAKDASGNTLVQGQDGKWYSDLTGATYDATNNVYTKDGTTVSAVENPTVSEVKLSNTGLDNGGNKITNVAAGTEDNDIVNVKQLKGSTIESSKLEYTDAGVGTMTLTMQDGSKVEIGGLQDKYIKGASLDGNKLTLTRNDDQKFEVDNIATTADIVGENSKVNLKFTGDDTSETGTITKINGATLNVLGGASEFTTANNIGVVKDGEALRVKLAKDINMGNGSVTFANAKDGDGNTLVQGQDGKWYSDLSDATYDATKNVYTKADGTTVSAVENPVVSHVKLSDTGLDNGGNKITNVAAGTEDTDIVNVKQLKGSTIQSSKLEYTDAGVGTMTLTMQDGSKVEIGGLQDKYIKGANLDGNKLTITRNDDQKFEVDNIATTADIVGENSKVNLKFTGDDTSEDGTITKINGATLNVLGGATEFTTANNIGVVKDGEALRVKLAKDVSMGNGSVTFANAKDASGNTLVQGQDGKWYSDLTDATYDATNNVYTKADGTPVSAVENPTVSEVKLSNTGLDNGGNKITNVAAGTVDTDIVNLGQLKGSTIGSSKVEYTDAGAGTITLTMQDGNEVKINGLQDKYVTGASLDGNKLTITRNDNEKFEVDKIATTDDIVGENSKVNLKFTGDDTSEDGTITKINGATLNVLGGASEFTTANNIGVVKDGEALRVKLAKDINMGNGSVTFANAKDASGNTLVQGQDGKWYSDLTDATYDATNNVYTKADGTTIDAVENPTVSEVKLSNTGLDNGGNKITNVAAGTEDTDIVNLGQLKGSTIGSSKVEYTDAGVGTVTLTMQDGKEVKINGLQDKYVTGTTFKDNTLTITRNDDTSFKVGDIASKTDMDSAVSNANLKFTGDDKSEDAAITKKNGETLTIYGGVAAKDDDGNSLLSDVNNVGVVKTDDGLQIKLAKNLSGIDSARIGGTLKDGVVTGGIYIANQSVTYNGSAKKTESGLYITGLANTAWNPNTDGIVSGRAATEDQLKAAYDGLSTTITANKIVAGDNITVTPLEDGSGTKVSLSDNLAFGDKDGKNIAINGNDAIISAGDGGSNKVVVDGAKSTVTAGTGANQVTVDGTKAGITAGEGANQVAIDGTKAGITAGEGANQVAIDGTKAGITAGEGANQVAIDGTKGQVTIGEAGEGLVMGNQTVTPKVIGADGKETDGTAQTGKFITGLDNTTWNPTEKGYVPDRAATEGQLKEIVGQFDGKIDDINNAKRSFNSDTGEVIKRGKDDILDIKGGAKGELSEGNIGVVNNTGATGFDVKLAKDLKDLNSVTSNTVTTKELTVSEKANIGNVSISNDNVTIGTGDSKTVITNENVTTGSVMTGNTTINNDGLTVKNEDSSKNITVANNNVSMGGNVVHNVGDGVEATDAINKGQFDRTVNAIGTGMNQMSNRISKLDTRVDRVGAGAAALAALHPLEYNADEKWEISAGVGNYRGASAVAVGAFYRPNGNTLVSLGTSYGGGENMVNAGVTWRVGEGETGNYSSKQAMAQEISSLKSVVSDQSSQLQAQNSKIEAQSQQLEEQNKKIEQLMQAIAELKK